MFLQKFFVSLVVVMTILCVPVCALAQQDMQVTMNELPDAPIPVVESSSSTLFTSATMTSPSKPIQAKKHRWLTAYNESVVALVVGEAVDTWGTHRNMTHPKFVCGYNLILGGGGAISTTENVLYDLYQIQALCGPSPLGEKANYAYDTTQLNGMFTEIGLAAKWGIAGNRDFARVEAADITSDILHALVVKYLNKKGGWRGKIGNATLLFHAEEHFRLGIGNFRTVASNNDPNTVFRNYPNEMPIFADTFTRWWGKR